VNLILGFHLPNRALRFLDTFIKLLRARDKVDWYDPLINKEDMILLNSDKDGLG